ncbi:MAG TPA: DNA-processing protein DprA [Fimbriimonadaceae bacterium]|nr:DNA-processing protein DprA [Fimbriimonadaceae bacterium]
MTDRTFGLYLASLPGVGGKSVVRILARNALLNRSPAEFMALSPEVLREEYGLLEKVAHTVASPPDGAYATAKKLGERLSGLGVNFVTPADAHYPARLEAFDPDPPGVLFLYGNTRLLTAPTFAVLASRRASSAALNQLEALAEEAVLAGEVLVAGHDTPEYQRSAVVPLRWGAPRILCLDRGLFRVLGAELKEEAFRAARLWRYQFDPHTDLAVSCFLPDAGFIGINNKVRDRLVAGLAERIDVVHMAEGGNMEKIARMALKAGRRVRVSDRCIQYRSFAELGADILPANPKV